MMKKPIRTHHSPPTLASVKIDITPIEKTPGIGVAGVYPKEVAETKVAIVHDLAQKNEYPLRCSIEKI